MSPIINETRFYELLNQAGGEHSPAGQNISDIKDGFLKVKTAAEKTKSQSLLATNDWLTPPNEK